MEKLTRVMDEPIDWKKYAGSHNLKIKNKEFLYFEKSYSDENHQNILETYYQITFDVFMENYLLSKLNFKIDPKIVNNQLIQGNIKKFDLIFDYLKANKHHTFYQSLFLTYLNEEESHFFKKNVGEPVLMLTKKVLEHQKIIIYGKELAQIDAYVFKEVKF